MGGLDQKPGASSLVHETMEGGESSAAPGKRTLSGQLTGNVQHKGAATGSAEDIHQTAAAGISGSGGPLPATSCIAGAAC